MDKDRLDYHLRGKGPFVVTCFSSLIDIVNPSLLFFLFVLYCQRIPSSEYLVTAAAAVNSFY